MNTTPQDYGIVVIGHGSRVREGVAEFESLMQIVKKKLPGRTVTHGFLELAKPTIREAIDANIAAGSRRLAVIPGLLFSAMHAKNDIPAEVLAARRDHPGVEISFGAPLQLHPKIMQLCRERILAAESKAQPASNRSEHCLVVVGRGTTDPDANGDIYKLSRFLEEGMGFGASLVCFSGAAHPSMPLGFERAASLGFKRVVVFPLFLFTGVLVKQTAGDVAKLRENHPDLDIVHSDYLGAHELVADVLIERADESMRGVATMNCSLCKYRIQIIGYEHQAGMAQQSHLHGHEHAHEHHHDETNAGVPANHDNHESDHCEHEHHHPEAHDHPYVVHPIEEKSFEIITRGYDWSKYSDAECAILKRLVHTNGDFSIVPDIFISPDAINAGVHALRKQITITTDISMVQSGLKRTLLAQLGLKTFCGVHDPETKQLAETDHLTRSAAGIRMAWKKFGNDQIVAIGDAPTAVEEALLLIFKQQWRPHLIIGLPVGFVGTREAKEKLRHCDTVPRITNSGTRGGSPWAAATVNALMILAVS